MGSRRLGYWLALEGVPLGISDLESGGHCFGEFLVGNEADRVECAQQFFVRFSNRRENRLCGPSLQCLEDTFDAHETGLVVDGLASHCLLYTSPSPRDS